MKEMRLFLLAYLVSSTLFSQVNTGDFAVRPLRRNPTVAWEVRPGFRDFGPIAYSSGVVVTGHINDSGGVFGYDAASGKRLWAIPGQMKSDPAVDARAAYVVTMVNGITYRLSAVDLKSGRKFWSVDGENLGSHEGGPVVGGGKVFLVSLNGKVNAWDAATGRALWERAYSPEKGSCPTAPALANGLLYFGGGDTPWARSQGRYLWALDAATGSVRWRYQVKPYANSDGACITAPAVANGIVVTTSERSVLALDANTGALLWKHENTTGDFATPIISGATAYAFTKSALQGWDLASGTQVFELPGAFNVDAGINRLWSAGEVLFFLANLSDEQGPTARKLPLYAFDTVSRQILWKHYVNRPNRIASVANWRTRFVLPIDGAVFYENESMLVKLQ